VLVFCAAANATSIRLTDEGITITATPGQSITLTLTVSGGSLICLDAIFSITGNGTFTGGMSTTDCANYGWQQGVAPPWPIISAGSAEISGGNFSYGVSGIVGYATLTYNGGIVVVSVRDGGLDGIFCGTWDGFTYNPAQPGFSTGVVTIVPEPITLVLLGLGGLFIRRRR
jgi:hypothetical protein